MSFNIYEISTIRKKLLILKQKSLINFSLFCLFLVFQETSVERKFSTMKNKVFWVKENYKVKLEIRFEKDQAVFSTEMFRFSSYIDGF